MSEIINDNQIVIGVGESELSPNLQIFSNSITGIADNQLKVAAEGFDLLLGTDIRKPEWTMVTLTRENGIWKLYQNGEQIDQRESLALLIGTKLFVGGFNYTEQLYKGDVKHVQVSSVVRNEEWINVDYLSQKNEFLNYGTISQTNELLISVPTAFVYDLGRIETVIDAIYSLSTVTKSDPLIIRTDLLHSVSFGFVFTNGLTVSSEIIVDYRLSVDPTTTVIAKYGLFNSIEKDFIFTNGLTVSSEIIVDYAISIGISKTINALYALFYEVQKETGFTYSIDERKKISTGIRSIYSIMHQDSLILPPSSVIIQVEE